MKKEVEFRLTKHIVFLENELSDYDIFVSLSWKEYSNERSKRRDVERWVENIINSSIDIAKIILTAEGIILPDTYKDIVYSLCLLSHFEEENLEKISKWIRLRNIISHEYLDIRWTAIKKFISETKPLYADFLTKVQKYIAERNISVTVKKKNKTANKINKTQI